jgi:RNA polymerase sigma-70 factor, ECF subfamily
MGAVAGSDAGSARQVDRSTWTAERLTALYQAHAADAFRYALHLTGRREDAEDVVQHVFLQAYATLEAGRDLASPRAWVIKATKHRALNLIRDRRDAPVAQVDPAAGCTSGDGEAEALAEVRAVLWTLPEPQHHAFVLRHWSGLSQDEIADVLATTPHAVESLLVRARAALVDARDAADPECAGVRRRLARMLAPTAAQRAHVAECRRCRTAEARLLRASEHAAAFALVPDPQVLQSLAASVPGFGASTAVVSAASAASAATKAGVVTKLALAATTAAVAVTAAHPLRSAVTHAILHDPPAHTVAAPRARHAPRPAATRAPVVRSAPVRSLPARSAAPLRGRAAQVHGPPPRRGRSASSHGKPASSHGKSAPAHARPGAEHGKSGAEHGTSASAPGHTEAPGSHAATGRGAGEGHRGSGHAHPHGHPGDRHRGKG